jgi:hypothetical protein
MKIQFEENLPSDVSLYIGATSIVSLHRLSLNIKRLLINVWSLTTACDSTMKEHTSPTMLPH